MSKYKADIDRSEFIANIYLGKYGSTTEDFKRYYYISIEGIFITVDTEMNDMWWSNPNDIAHNATEFYLKEDKPNVPTRL